MDSLPQLYLNGTALKGYDYEIQMNIDAEHLYDLVVKGELCPRNENGEYLLKEPQVNLIELELCLQVIPNKKMFVKKEDGSVESVTHYCEEGVIDFKALNNSIDLRTGNRISHARQIKPYAAHPNKYIYEYCRSKVISWLREQLYTLPIHIEVDLDCEMELVELIIKGKPQKRPIVYRYKDEYGTSKSISLLGCRLPFSEGDDPLVSPEIMRKMPILHYKLAKAANQSDDFLIEIAKQGLQDVGYDGPMPAIPGDATECLSVVIKHSGSQEATDRRDATEKSYDNIMLNPDSLPYHHNGKLYRCDFNEKLEALTPQGMYHEGKADELWKSLIEIIGKKEIGIGRKPNKPK